MGIVLSRVLYQRTKHDFAFFCPGCKDFHGITTDQTQEDKWTITGPHDKPTFHPSVHLRIGHYSKRHKTGQYCEECEDAKKEKRETECVVCHSFVRDGMIQFLNDCTHSLAGQTVPLDNLPKEMLDRHGVSSS